MLYEHPLHAALRMFDEELLSVDEARPIVEASLVRFPASAFSAASWGFSRPTLAAFDMTGVSP
jgi:hypothetical protein